MARPLVTAGPGKELEAGVFPGVDPLSAPFWADGENVEFRLGGVVSSKGYTSLAALGGTASELAQAFITGGEQRVYAAVEEQVILISSSTGLSVLGAFPSPGEPVFEIFGSFLLGTNNVNPIRVWKNTGTFDAIVGSPSPIPFNRAKILHRRDNHMLAFNTSLGENNYSWSSASNIDDWVATSSNSAGNGFIRDLDSEIMAAVDLGPVVAVYSRETMGIVRFVGQPNVFAHTPAINGVGAVGPRSVCQVGTKNYGLNRQGVFETDGASFNYLDEPAFHEWLVANVDFDQGSKVKSYHNEDLASVIWFFERTNGQSRYGFGYNYRSGAFRKYNLQIEVALERQVFPTPIAAVGGDIVQLNVGNSLNGAPFSKWVRTKPIAAQDATSFKAWSHLKTVGKFTNSDVKFGVCESEDPNTDDIEWFSTQDLAFENWIDRESAYLLLEFRADALDSQFSFSQLQVQGEVTGKVSA